MNWKSSCIYAALFVTASILALFLSDLFTGIYHQTGGQNEAIRWGISIFVLVVMNFVVVVSGKKLSSSQLKPALPAHPETAFADKKIQTDTNWIIFCPHCRTNNILRKAVLIGLQPVCGRCGTILEEADFFSYAYESEYIAVKSARNQPIYTETKLNQPNSVQADLTSRVSGNGQTMASNKSVSEPVFIEESAGNELKNEFIRLLFHDRAKADRIVASIKTKNPERTERWCWEKAIDDLIRDRR